MAQGRVPGPLSIRAVLAPVRTRAYGAGLLIAVAAACWAVTAQRMNGMDMGPGTELGGFGWFAGVWAVMMAAMMLPSLVPATPARAPFLFAAGFLVPWSVAGMTAYALVEALRSLDLGLLSWADGGRYVAAGVIGGAAAYELSRPQEACLRRCRVAARGRTPRAGAAASVRAGAGLGLVCIGCCWALMAALFALGVMSVQWMVVIAALIAIEKLSPWERAPRAVVVVLAALALAVALAPEQVPGLTIPA
jgi:predicted metal-binding membrane protein